MRMAGIQAFELKFDFALDISENMDLHADITLSELGANIFSPITCDLKLASISIQNLKAEKLKENAFLSMNFKADYYNISQGEAEPMIENWPLKISYSSAESKTIIPRKQY